LRSTLLLILASIIAVQSHSQYYLRGVVKDENGQAVYNAKIFLASKGTVPFYTGNSGAFGIPIAKPTDSISIVAEGFETLKTLADARKYNTYTVKFLAANATVAKHKLSTMLPENADDISEIYNHQ